MKGPFLKVPVPAYSAKQKRKFWGVERKRPEKSFGLDLLLMGYVPIIYYSGMTPAAYW
jgi:hypothetical protein